MQVVSGVTTGRNLRQLNLWVEEQEPSQFASDIARAASNGNT